MSRAVVIGAGLAGCEAAWHLANQGVLVDLMEQKPHRMSPAHHSGQFAELVCSNSLKAERADSAAGLLKLEMRRLGSLCLAAADLCRVPAGGALAVDRDAFSARITACILAHPRIRVVEGEAESIPGEGVAIVATGPLTDGRLAADISRLCGESLSFYDAAAPIVTAESVDPDFSFRASRYGREGEDGSGDYVNCPLDKAEYETFYHALVAAGTAPLKEFDRPRHYEGCMPVEALAARGEDTLRFGPMKPVGLTDPRTGKRPWAVVQLRAENAERSLYNLVGFQTNLTFPEQKRVFGLIPALSRAAFARYGVMHRNTFLDSPRLLNPSFSLKAAPHIFFAGQITGVEGYMESAASGILAGFQAERILAGKPPLPFPKTTMTGALAAYISTENPNFQPMGANFGILPPLDEPPRGKRERYEALSRRALADLEKTLNHVTDDVYSINGGLNP